MRILALTSLIPLFLPSFTRSAQSGQPGDFPQFQILAGPQSGELQPGRPTSLDCDWVAPSQPEVVWTKDGIPLDLTTTSSSSSGSGRLLTNGSLLLSGERSQAGTYQCSLTVDGVGTLLSSPARLLAADNPEFLVEPRSLTIYQTQTAVFQCEAAAGEVRGPR